MIRINEIQAALYGLVGWKQSINPTYAIVDSANLVSRSGRYFQEFSSMVTVENVKENQGYPLISDADFNTLLAGISKSSISSSLLRVFDEDDFLESKLLYPYANNWSNTIENGTDFVGFEITIPTRTDLMSVLNLIYTSFDAEDTVKILLFHSSIKDPIQTKEITVEENSETKTELGWDLSSTRYAGGTYYIGYLTDGLTAKAVNRNWDNSGAESCFLTVGLKAIKVSGWNAETLFDIDDIEYTAETYGLNFNITTWKDYTNVIKANQSKFTELIGLQAAVEVLDLILKSTRSNRNERLISQNVLLERDGILSIEKGTQRVDAVIPKLKREIEKLKSNFIETPQIKRATL